MFIPNQTQVFRVRALLSLLCCIAILLCGIPSLQWKIAYEHSAGLMATREMTVDISIYTCVMALFCIPVNLYELFAKRQLRSRLLYNLRLSQTVTEGVVMLVIAIGMLPFFPDKPNITRPDMITMHIILPMLTIATFILYTPDRGKLRPLQRLWGLLLITFYSMVMISLIWFGIVPESQAPYSFLCIRSISLGYLLFAVSVIFGGGLVFSTFFYQLNFAASKRLDDQ